MRLTSSIICIMLFWKERPGENCRLPITYLSAVYAPSDERWRDEREAHLVDTDMSRYPASFLILLLHFVYPSFFHTLLDTLRIVE